MGSNSSPGGSNSRKSSSLFFSRRKTAFEDVGVFKLSNAELAFLPNEVRTRLGRAVGHLPPAPSVFKSRGAVLFVDVSGFTKLGSELRNAHGPEKGAELLAEQITSVLATLTQLCLDHGGDVSKFAGDALLCVWESGPEDSMFQSAKECAIAMLAAMRRIQAEKQVKLDIHGGLARGSILHFHLGSADDRLRWYLMAGEAMAGAACLVDAASPGEIMCAETAETSRSVRAASQASMYQTGPTQLSPRSTAPTDARGTDLAMSPPPAHKSNALWSPRAASEHKSPGNSPKVPDRNIKEVEVEEDTPPGSREPSLSSPAVVSGGNGKSRKRNDTVTRNNDKVNHFLFMAQSSTGARVNRSDLSELSFPKPFEGRGTMLSITNDALRERAVSSIAATFIRDDVSRGRMSTSNSSSVETIIILTAESAAHSGSSNSLPSASGGAARGRIATEEDPILRAGLPRTCNVYIPKSLRRGVIEDIKGEMRKGVSIVFVDIEDMALSDEEMERQTISDVKLDALNSSFVKMTRITHAFGGEVRDMLFDDKGCVFIAVFGVHNVPKDDDALPSEPPAHPAQRLMEKGAVGVTGTRTVTSLRGAKSTRNLHTLALDESSELRATKAAVAINATVASCRVGVSSGTCFVGMCGTEKRHDFIVIGHDVNMAARLMVQAERGQVVVSPDVWAVASKMLPFTERKVQMQKKNATTSSVAYVPEQSIARRESFQAEYRYELFDSDLFVGRTEELESVEESLNKMCLSSSSAAHSGCIVIEADLGMGKSAFVSRVRKMGKGRISICHGTCRDPLEDFHPWRSILESLTGLRPDMKVQEIKDALKNFESSTMKIDYVALARIFPFFTEIFSLPPPSAEDIQAREEDVFGEKHRRQIAAVGRTVAGLLVMGNRASKKAGARGTLLVMENVEKIDVPSLLLLEYLIDHLDSAKRLALCLTAKTRPNAGQQQQPSNIGRRASLMVVSLTETMSFETRRMNHVYLVVHKASKAKSKLNLSLAGLSKQDTEDLVSRVLGYKASPEVNSYLFRVTKGCPMHLTMLLQYVKDLRLISRKGGAEYDWVRDAQRDLESKPAMNTIEGVIRHRFEEGLDAAGKNVLKLASIIQSGEFDAIFIAEGLKQTLGKPVTESDVLSKLRQARSLGFVVHIEDKKSPEREHAWSFKHDTIADVIFNSIQRDEAVKWVEKIEEAYKALELRLKLGFFGRVDDFEKV